MPIPTPPDEAARLQALRDQRILDTAPERTFDDITEMAAQVCGTPTALISLVDAERQWFKSRLGLPLSETARDFSFCAHTMLQPDLMVVPDALKDPRFATNPLVTENPNIRFYAGAPLTDGAGRPMGALCVIDSVPRELTPEQAAALRELGRQTVAQLELRRKLADLARRMAEKRRADAARDRFFGLSSDLLCVAAMDGRILSVNPAWSATLGRPAEEITGGPLADLLCSDDRPVWTDECQRAIALNEPISFECRLTAADCERIILWSVAPAREEQLLYVAGRDVTERRRAEAMQLAAAVARARAESADALARAKDEFLLALSHELRTPLHQMRMAAALVRASGPVSPDGAQALDVLDRAIRAETRMVGDLLDISAIVTGRLRLDMRTVSPDDVVEWAVEAVRLSAAEKRIAVESELDRTPHAVNGDPDRLQQVVLNLLANAVKFTPEGGRIRVTLDYPAGQARIRVSDTGVGIAPEFLPHVFEPFRQADVTRTRIHGGLGLGLAIAKRIIDAHRGTLRADSPGPGQGATFTITLPPAA